MTSGAEGGAPSSTPAAACPPVRGAAATSSWAAGSSSPWLLGEGGGWVGGQPGIKERVQSVPQPGMACGGSLCCSRWLLLAGGGGERQTRQAVCPRQALSVPWRGSMMRSCAAAGVCAAPDLCGVPPRPAPGLLVRARTLDLATPMYWLSALAAGRQGAGVSAPTSSRVWALALSLGCRQAGAEGPCPAGGGR